MKKTKRHMLFAGGGTGGHVYPNVAVYERFCAAQKEAGQSAADAGLFFLSKRPGDIQIAQKLTLNAVHSPVLPMPGGLRPQAWLRFALAFRAALKHAHKVLLEHEIDAVVASGGFVSGPAVVAACRLGLPVALINLDGVPGRANRRLARCRSKGGLRIFSVYASAHLPTAQIIGLPLRKASLGAADGWTPQSARTFLGLDPNKPVLFVTGATHGATSMIEGLVYLLRSAAWRKALAGWQIYHQCGTYDREKLQRSYDESGVHAHVVPYCAKMSAAWAAASFCISRAGAGSCAEIWANGIPSALIPNPYHKDGHQKANAQPLVDAGGGFLLTDMRGDGQANAAAWEPALLQAIEDTGLRASMAHALRASMPKDGALDVCDWLLGALEQF